MLEPLRRRVGSVRVRLTIVATLVFAFAFAFASIALVWQVRHSLEDRARSVGERVLNDTVRQAQAGIAAPGEAGTVTWIAGPEGTLVYTGHQLPGGLPALTPVTQIYGSTSNAPLGDNAIVFSRQISGPGGPVTVAVASPLESVRRSVDALVRILWFAIPVLVAGVGALVWFLTGRALRPVEAIRSEVEEISHTTMHRRVPVPTARDAVRNLAVTMNEMLDRLEHAGVRQRTFIADASHELRSPVAAIRTEVEVALRDPSGTDWSSVAERVLAEDERLGALVDDLLELARIDEGLPLQRAEVDLDDVVLADVARRNGAIAIDTTAVSGAEVFGDQRRLAQVVRNLLDNAVRHARTQVRIGVQSVADEVTLNVDDDGAGVAPEDRERVFERFTGLV
jgi:signal transduction histidine kinase